MHRRVYERGNADAYLFFPMMFDHFDNEYAAGDANDGLLEARMAVSRDGVNLSYISREAFLPRGVGRHRRNNTGVYSGAFDAGSTAVASGLVHTAEQTLLFGWGQQYTHGGDRGYQLKPPQGGQIVVVYVSPEGFSSLNAMWGYRMGIISVTLRHEDLDLLQQFLDYFGIFCKILKVYLVW